MLDFLESLRFNAPELAEGLLVTVQLTLVGAAGALLLSFIFGLMSLSGNIVLRGISRVIVEFFRGTSLYVQMFWLAFALPILGYKLDVFFCAVVALALNYGAYGSEVVRGAITAVPKAQWEATVALNMSPLHRMRRVIMPQAWVGMIPPFNNLLIQLIKSTPLAALILVFELFYRANQLRSSTGNTVATYLMVLIVYFLLAYVFTLAMNALEAAASARLGRAGKPSLRQLFRTHSSDEAAADEVAAATTAPKPAAESEKVPADAGPGSRPNGGDPR
ncbi:ectoine/hydroxyectoine ABC transporter permease subunit EhuC [Propionibacteriaceae bacterium Y2011]